MTCFRDCTQHRLCCPFSSFFFFIGCSHAFFFSILSSFFVWVIELFSSLYWNVRACRNADCRHRLFLRVLAPGLQRRFIRRIRAAFPYCFTIECFFYFFVVVVVLVFYGDGLRHSKRARQDQFPPQCLQVSSRPYQKQCNNQ